MLYKYKGRLYHGTISEINKVDVNEGRNRKDFGKAGGILSFFNKNK